MQYEPTDPNVPSHFFEGVNRADFGSLGGRLIPCSRFAMAHAVDLAWRVWWYHPQTSFNRGTEHEGDNLWYLLGDEDSAQVLREMEQWKRVAPLALELWRDLLSLSSRDEHGALLARIMDMQNALLTAWGVHPTAPVPWRMGFFYRTITLDGRWLLTEHEVPPFDITIFRQLLPNHLGDGERHFLMDDPVTRRMPELFQEPPAPVPAGSPPRLRVIDGRRDL